MSAGQIGLPPGWAIAKLADLAYFAGRIGWKGLTAQEYRDSGAMLLSTFNLNHGNQVDFTRVNYVSMERYEESPEIMVEDDDVLLTKDGAGIGKLGIVAGLPSIATVNSSLLLLRAGKALLPKFMFFALAGPSMQRIVQERITGSTTPHLFQRDIGTFDLPVPPLNEQRRIVAKIEALQARSSAAKEALDAIPALLEKFRQSVLAAAFRGDLTREWREAHPDVEPAAKLLERIRAERKRRWVEANPKKAYVEPEPVDTEGLPELPGGWCWASLEEVSSATRSICYGVVQPGEPDSDGVPLVRVCDVEGGVIGVKGLRTISRTIANEYNRSELLGGEVLVTVVGTIGRTAIAPPELRGANIARAVARVVPSALLGSAWVDFALQSPLLQDALVRESREVARKTLNIGTLERMAIPVAPQTEAAKVVEFVQRLLDFQNAARERQESLTKPLLALPQSILSKAFRGALVPQDPNDEPASALLDRIRRERDGQGAQTAKRGRGRPKKQEQEAQ